MSESSTKKVEKKLPEQLSMEKAMELAYKCLEEGATMGNQVKLNASVYINVDQRRSQGDPIEMDGMIITLCAFYKLNKIKITPEDVLTTFKTSPKLLNEVHDYVSQETGIPVPLLKGLGSIETPKQFIETRKALKNGDFQVSL